MAVLEVAIGVVFYFVTLSLLCSTVAEWWSRRQDKRGALLEDGIRLLLGGRRRRTRADGGNLKAPPASPRADAGDFLERVLSHSLIRTRGSEEFPERIDPQDFARALLDVAGGGEVIDGLQKTEDAISKIEQPAVKQALSAMLIGTQTTVEDVQARIAGWFDDAMNETTRVYRRAMDLVVRWIALVLVLVLNADALALMEVLWKDPSRREAIVALAEQAQLPRDADPLMADQIVDFGTRQLEPFPIGWPALPDWDSDPRGFPAERGLVVGILMKLAGLAVTFLAVSLGAPFWFDLLRQLLSLRRASSEDAPPTAGAKDSAQ